jgi:hypothetical protein
VYYQIDITVLTIPTLNIPPNPTFLPTAAPVLGSEVLVLTLELNGIVAPPVVIADNIVVGVILSTAIVLVPNKSVKLFIEVGFMLMTVSCSSYLWLEEGWKGIEGLTDIGRTSTPAPAHSLLNAMYRNSGELKPKKSTPQKSIRTINDTLPLAHLRFQSHPNNPHISPSLLHSRWCIGRSGRRISI